MSLARRMDQLEEAIRAKLEPPGGPLGVEFLIVSTREEDLALRRYRSEHPEPPRRPIRPGDYFDLPNARSVSATEWLRERGVEVPPADERKNDQTSPKEQGGNDQ